MCRNVPRSPCGNDRESPHSSGQKLQNARIPHILGTQRAAPLKPHIFGVGERVGVYFNWCIRRSLKLLLNLGTKWPMAAIFFPFFICLKVVQFSSLCTPPAAKVRAGRLKMTTSTFTIINRGDWSKEKRQDFCCKVHDRAQSFRFGFIHYP